MILRAEKQTNGKYETYLEVPVIPLTVQYTSEDLETLEKNGVICGRDSYNAGTTLKFQVNPALSEKVVTSILDAVSE